MLTIKRSFSYKLHLLVFCVVLDRDVLNEFTNVFGPVKAFIASYMYCILKVITFLTCYYTLSKPLEMPMVSNH